MHFLVRDKEGCDSRRGWLKVFERWQMNSKIFEYENFKDNVLDPLIPCSLDQSVRESLAQDLEKTVEGMTHAGAVRISKEIQYLAYNLATEVSKCKTSISKYLEDNGGAVSVETRALRNYHRTDGSIPAISTNTIYKLRLTDGGILCEINEESARELLRLWDRVHYSSLEEVSEEFWHDVYSALVRYKALEGFGYQAAITRACFKTLVDKFGVEGELFASPFNRYCDNYWSAFGDTDICFGSRGSFFSNSFSPSTGCFQANPPFSSGVIIAALDKIEILLRCATGPLTFIMVLPYWPQDEFWIDLEKRKFFITSTLIVDSDHCYMEGTGYWQTTQSNRLSGFTTAFVFLQNEAGARSVAMDHDSIVESLALDTSGHQSSASRDSYVPKERRPKSS
jgi:hypothetical protein